MRRGEGALWDELRASARWGRRVTDRTQEGMPDCWVNLELGPMLVELKAPAASATSVGLRLDQAGQLTSAALGGVPSALLVTIVNPKTRAYLMIGVRTLIELVRRIDDRGAHAEGRVRTMLKGLRWNGERFNTWPTTGLDGDRILLQACGWGALIICRGGLAGPVAMRRLAAYIERSERLSIEGNCAFVTALTGASERLLEAFRELC